MSLADAAAVAAFLAATPAVSAPLRAVAALGLPDAWIGAGLVRNAVWDRQSGFALGTNPPADVDVVWFDPMRVDPTENAALEARLRALCPGPAWSVRNQAGMHMRNGDAPYQDSGRAVAHWPETATAIAARWQGGGVELLAPWGLGDLLGLVLRPTPAFAVDPAKRAVFVTRCQEKRWQARWPRLRVLPA
jgi:hypothetical protein